MKRYFCKILFIAILLSCEREVDIELPAFEQKLVINSFLDKDSIIRISVAGTGSPFDEDPNWIDDATVILICGANCDTLVRIDTGLYQSTLTAVALQEYQVVIQAPGYLAAKAKETVPETVSGFEISNLRDSVATTEEGCFFSEFTLMFDDNPNAENFYEVSAFNLVHLSNNGYSLRNVPCFSNDPIVYSDNNQSDYRLTFLFNDAYFNGQPITIKMNFLPDAYGTPNGMQGELVDPDYKLIVVLRSVSESYYRYKKMLPEHLNAQEYDFWQGQGDPVEMFTNIEGGYGIFGAYSTVRDTLSH